MERATVNSVELAYELLGDGPPLALTAYGWDFPGETMRLLAEDLSSDYRVLIWDRRNSGSSGIAVSGACSEEEVFADDLYSLLDHLGMLPAIVGGVSGGGIVSEVFAYKHPESTTAVLVVRVPNDSPEFFRNKADNRYFEPAKLAEERGMSAVLEVEGNPWSWLANRSEQDRRHLESLRPSVFAAVLRSWGRIQPGGLPHFGGLSPEQLRTIHAPTLILTGYDSGHPRETGDQLHALLANSELHYAEDIFTESQIEQFQRGMEEDHVTGPPLLVAGHAPAIRGFLNSLVL